MAPGGRAEGGFPVAAGFSLRRQRLEACAALCLELPSKNPKGGWLYYPSLNNLFANIPGEVTQEINEILLETSGFFLERIVSGGQATLPGEWYDQETHEWVVLLAGAAGLLFEGEDQVRVLRPGDYLLIPAHCRHRVEWTDPEEKTVWLALHFREGEVTTSPSP